MAADREPVVRPVVPAEPVQAERLSEALARLRERTPLEPDTVERDPAEPVEQEPAAVEPAEPVEPAAVEPAAVDPAEPVEPAAVEPAAREPAAPEEPAAVEPSPVDRTETVRAAKPWLRPAFRRLAARDPSAAGRLVLALLPAQRAADPHPVAYDLVLSDVVVAHVTSDSVGVHVQQDAARRPASEVDFQLVGDLASVARLLRAGRVRRRLRVPPGRMARVRGDRGRLAALDRLIDARLTTCDLHAAGVRLDPVLAFTLAGLMIEPGWTTAERFTIGHREPASTVPGAYVHVRDGRPVLASAEPPHGPVATVLVGAGGDVLGALTGAADVEVVGEQRPLALLRQWLDRAQSG